MSDSAAARLSKEDQQIRENVEEVARYDASGRRPVLLSFYIGLAWLLVGTFFGDVASFKFNFPDWWSHWDWLTFGRVRPAHLNAMIYGWASTSMFGVSLWMMPRLLRTPLRWANLASAGILVWTVGVVVGVVLMLAGVTDGLEWLEMDRYLADPLLVLGAGLVGASIWRTLMDRQVKHLYVSVWYVAASYLWFPVIFTVGNLPFYRGVESAAVNWFYAHNALGLWLTTVNLGVIYYLIPKIVGRPIYSYWLSLVGFWALAFFYALNGMHHLVGGPLPQWMITTSITASIMMFIPVLAVGVNQHMTVVGRFGAMRYSPTLTFIVLAAMSYTAVSLQGIMTALVEVNRVSHFTQWTIAHSHVGVYMFVTFALFGALYYILPRLIGREWPSAQLIRLHFWLVAVGMVVYVVGLSIGGVIQGLDMLDPAKSFQTSVEATIPWLWVRSASAVVLTLGHLVFLYHTYLMVMRRGPELEAPPFYAVKPILIDEPAPAALREGGRP
ncbi:MAG: cbb3-type cytochrome c oxidase subunit I [Pseudomonadota bacterium]|uniref:cbb3-type cytochrome c oxidase subunit I n=1 Tax=Thermithiobacillus tepidarius TaxID=929 RepID=UPI0004192F2D|nr:cbb3-type cytochrome c oxidase subunit I [Thermithiobacillus tepidarius]